ncbi:MAG: argininosuccinate synthase [Campylobacterota bacterium]|nr:argininosuccinate synthase [Campylobacterota bacterium]
MSTKRKAIALFSGGLDSTLAIKLIIDQGIDVIACNINTGFGATRDRKEHMQNMCDQVGAELKIIDIQHEYLQDVLFDPKHGYGKHFNPCIDCHAKMFAVAKRIMEGEGASFLISGEVLGQRPMSQNSDALKTVLNEANVNGLLIRPLSAKRLEPTIAETEGWVDREKLEGIQGRTRDRQMELVEEFGLTDYESPGGGCLLTDANFAIKINDYIKYDEQFEIKDIPVLKWGRHFRLSDGAKMVIGRNAEENEKLQEIENDKFVHIKTVGIPGPHVLLSANASEADRTFALRAILTYCKTTAETEYTLDVEGEQINVAPLASRSEAAAYSIL